MGTFFRLLVVFAFFGFIAVLGFHSGKPKLFLIIGVGGAVFLALMTLLTNHQKKRELDAMRTLTQNLHRPNEAVVVDVLKYVQWGLPTVAVLGVAKGVLTHEQPFQFLGFGVLLPIALGFSYLRKVVQGADSWLSARMRLTGVTHRSVEFVLLADANASSGPIRVQAEYSRHMSSNGESGTSRSELIWRSPPIAMEPVKVADCAEFRAQIAMPQDFPQPLVADTSAWRRHWNIKIQPSPQRTLNFDFTVPVTVAPDV
jgi:hypothetical protein